MSEMHSHSQPHTRTSTSGDVRAGPGDAGAQDRPEVLPKTPQDRRRARSAGPFTVAVIAAGLLILGIWWLLV